MPSSADAICDGAGPQVFDDRLLNEQVFDERAWQTLVSTDTPILITDKAPIATTLLSDLTNLNGAHIAEAEAHTGESVRTTVETLLDAEAPRPDGPLYARNMLASDLIGVGDAVPPALVSLNWPRQLPPDLRPDWTWVMVGDAGTTTELHLDTLWSAAWNLLLSGHKRWQFYPPEHHYSTARLPKGSRALLPSGRTRNTPVEFDQRPGEFVITPTGWAHTVQNIEHSAAITGNFINDTNIDHIIGLCETADDLGTAHILRSVARHFRQS